MKPKPFPFLMPGQREAPMGPPAWWTRLLRWRREAKALRDSRIWGVWEAMSQAQKMRYMERHAGAQTHRVRTVYPSWAARWRPVRHRRNARGKIRMRGIQ